MIEQEVMTGDMTQAQRWSQHLQRRVIRLLLQHNGPLFRNQFQHFFVNSKLPPIPVLQRYDHYIKLATLSSELLDGILPRIRRQLSLKTNRLRLREEAPTRGDIDWLRTIERNQILSPGLPALQFETRLRQRTQETPENILTVAVLLAYRQELRLAQNNQPDDETLVEQEKRTIASAEERVEHELAAPYARLLLEQARKANIQTFIQTVARHLRPGPSPYRDLIDWWQRFSRFRLGRTERERALALASKRDDEKTDAWLYELWIVLEILHLLQATEAIQTQEIKVATDLLQCIFTWQGRRFRLLYNRQLDTSTTFKSDWEHGPPTRPDYTIERETPLEVRYQGRFIWREPPVVLDAKYYLGGSDPTNTHGPVKKLLGDMMLLGAERGVLFFPRLPEPEGAQQSTRSIRRSGQQYALKQGRPQQVDLYHLEPNMPLADLQKRLGAILDNASRHLPERPQPACCGLFLNLRTINANRSTFSEQMILCPKPHIGPDVFDLVNVNTDCLKNPRLCHAIGQSIVPPFVTQISSDHEAQDDDRPMRLTIKNKSD